MWLSRGEAKKAMDATKLFCSAYSFLAAESFAMKLPQYHFEPSLHSFKHTAVCLSQQLICGFTFVRPRGNLSARWPACRGRSMAAHAANAP